MSLEFTSTPDVSGGDERLSFKALANDDASVGQASINFEGDNLLIAWSDARRKVPYPGGLIVAADAGKRRSHGGPRLKQWVNASQL
jgi:hypothetical protein